LANSYSNNFQIIEVTLTKCTGGGCQSDADIENVIKNALVEVLIVNTYFDFDDYKTPVKQYLDDTFYVNLIPGFEKENKVYLRENEAEVQDGFFHYTPDGTKSKFVGFSKSTESINPYNSADEDYYSKFSLPFVLSSIQRFSS
jgi:hypothetical protein